MRTLSIDIGTNSTLYLIANVTPTSFELVERGIASNRLGADKREDGSLSPELIEDNRQILLKMLRRGEDLGCDAVKAVGTHALRTAANAEAFVAMTNSIGLNFQIIDGEQEAALAWRGVVGETPQTQSKAIIDIGGGSSELICGHGNHIDFSDSIPIGAVTLMKKFSEDPPTSDEIIHWSAEVRRQFQNWNGVVPDATPLIGIAGTCTSLASLKLEITKYKPGLIEDCQLSHHEVKVWRNKFFSQPLTERQKLPGMPPGRAEIIPAGALLLDEAMKAISKQTLKVSERGLIFGLAWEMSEGKI